MSSVCRHVSSIVIVKFVDICPMIIVHTALDALRRPLMGAGATDAAAAASTVKVTRRLIILHITIPEMHHNNMCTGSGLWHFLYHLVHKFI